MDRALAGFGRIVHRGHACERATYGSSGRSLGDPAEYVLVSVASDGEAGGVRQQRHFQAGRTGTAEGTSVHPKIISQTIDATG